MSDIFDDLPERRSMQRIWQGIIARDVVSVSTRASVTIPDLDPDMRIDGCRWQQRGTVTFPVRGDDCLVVFDNNMEAWVICWWPFS